MMKLKLIEQTGKPYRIFAEHLESKAIDQFVQAMQQESVVKGALMPDAHAGYTLPIGAVVAVDGMVFPSFVGYDIGCGMCAVKTTFSASDIRENARVIYDEIYRMLPVGFNYRKTPYDWPVSDRPDCSRFVRDLLDKGNGLFQLGSLGSGNHFVEIGEDENRSVWIVIHSGSRNLGHTVATHYMQMVSPDGKAREGFYGLRTGTSAGQDYVQDLMFGLAFALKNRQAILETVVQALRRFVSGNTLPDTLINRNHNHAELKDGLWIHRKGATHAEAGMQGVIPGNMRDGSFIVTGKGHPDSLSSSSHGAGRIMGRNAAKASIDLDAFVHTMAERGIVAKVDRSTLDESPEAYKNIWEVMAMQADLVDIKHHIKPIINIKG